MLCPASQLESFIKEHCGGEVFFLTALGVVFDFRQLAYVEALVDFIERESIDEICVVHDVACPFIKSVLAKEKGYGTYAEGVLLDLLIDHFSDIMQNTITGEQKVKLARCNVERQVSEVFANELLRQVVREYNISLKGLLSAKAEGWLKPITLKLKEIHQ